MNSERHPNPEDETILDREIQRIREEPVDPGLVEAAAARVWNNVQAEHASHGIHGCADFQAMLPAYREGTLSAARKLLLQDHLRECLTCRRVFVGVEPKPVRPVRPTIAPVWRVIVSGDVYQTVKDYVEARELKLGNESYYSIVGVEEGVV